MSNNISKEYVSFAKKNIYEYLKIIMNKKFKKDIADILVEDKKGFYETTASTIIKLSKRTLKKIR